MWEAKTDREIAQGVCEKFVSLTFQADNANDYASWLRTIALSIPS